MPDLIEELVNDGMQRLTSLKAALFPHGADVETAVFVGRPAHGIVEHARAGAFDLIVMGTHGRTGLSHIFMGSVAERVVRTAPCAVLTVRERAAIPVLTPTGSVEAA
jgi:nucleotide-binding universal stress UspA family protein